MVTFYDPPCVREVPSCMVLGSLFPELNTSAGQWLNKIKAVAEQIYPKSDAHAAQHYWKIDVWNPKNGIFLLKDLELKFQSLQWVLIPCTSGEENGRM
eukprot:6247584-Amphidinium_carterae.1